MNIENIIDKYFIDNYNIDTNKDYQVLFYDKYKLLVSERIDLIAKIKYLESIKEGRKTIFFDNLYKATIEAFSEGNYTEPGNNEKKSFDKYKEIFIKLNDDIKNNGFNEKKSVLPVGNNGAIIDGGHRAAVSIFNNLEAPIVEFDKISVNYNLAFFKDRLLEPLYLDYLCLQYAKMKENIYVICLWPILEQIEKKEALDIIESNLNVVYKKEIELTYNGLRNFMTEIYGGQPWIGNPSNNFTGVGVKLDACYKKNNSLTCIVVEEKDIKKILELKKNIREKIKIGNHSIHSTDNKEETIQMLSLLLNSNSIDFLNNAQLGKYPDVYKKLDKIKKVLNENKISIEDVVIDSGTVLALYGLRENDDIDILINEKEISKLPENIDTHNNYINYYIKSLDDMIYNPENYFNFYGFKFLILTQVKKMKINRMNSKDIGEKDIKDVEILSKYYNQTESKLDFQKYRLKFKRKVRNVKRSLKTIIKTILKKLKLFDFIKKIYTK